MHIDTSDKAIKRFNYLSDTMLRFISKEGANQFPSVVFLANRMFLSDKMNIIKDKNLPFKLNQGCNFTWYSDKPEKPPEALIPVPQTNYDKIFVNTRFCIKEIIESNLLCFKQYSDNPSDIVDSFTMGNDKNYFTTADSLQYGLLKNKQNINISTLDLNVSEIHCIYRYKDSLDVFITDHKLFFINPSSKTARSVFTDEKRIFKDFCICSNGKIVLATNDKGLVLLPPKDTIDISYNTNFTLQKEMLEYKDWYVDEPNPEYVPPDPETGEGGSGSPTIRVHYDNGMPSDNNLTFCKSLGITVHIGNASTGTMFSIDDPKDRGSSSSGVNYHKYIYKYEIKHSLGGYELGDYSYNLSYKPIEFIIDKDLIYIYDSSHVDCYKYEADRTIEGQSDKRLIFSLRSVNGISDIKKFGCDGPKDFFYISNDNKLYTSVKESDIDFPLIFIPIDFIYKRDQNTKNLKCQVKKCSIRRLIRVMISDEELHELLKVYGTTPTFSFIHHHNTFIYFGNDDRNKAAKEVKQIANAFDIGY